MTADDRWKRNNIFKHHFPVGRDSPPPPFRIFPPLVLKNCHKTFTQGLGCYDTLRSKCKANLDEGQFKKKKHSLPSPWLNKPNGNDLFKLEHPADASSLKQPGVLGKHRCLARSQNSCAQTNATGARPPARSGLVPSSASGKTLRRGV